MTERLSLELDPQQKARTVYYPHYDYVKALLSILDGQPRSRITGMISRLEKIRGTPQDPKDWTNPDEWISKRLEGEYYNLAKAIWEGSGKTVNPRWASESFFLITTYILMEENSQGLLQVNESGRDYVEDPYGETVRRIDRIEGLDKILSIIAERGPVKRSDFLPEWSAYLPTISNFRAESVINDSLYRRLGYLTSGGFIHRTGIVYEITQKGLEYLGKLGAEEGSPPSELHKVYHLARKQRKDIRDQLAGTLKVMDPTRFEHLIGRLLEEMTYRNIQVTSPSHDKGVDVVADIELGITSVREVIQAKRQSGSISRPVLDALRGSLHRFNATRGTIITTGSFSKGTKQAAFEPGAAPITLIDGEKLLDLLVEHNIGVRKKSVDVLELDEASLEVEVEPEEEAPTGELISPGG